MKMTKDIFPNENPFKNKKYYIYGSGDYGALTAINLEKNGIKAYGFIDKNAEKIKTRLGLPVFKPEDILSSWETGKNNKIIIAVKNSELINEIALILINAGLKKYRFYTVFFRKGACWLF